VKAPADCRLIGRWRIAEADSGIAITSTLRSGDARYLPGF
jgi:hypothetical protein